MKKFLQYKEWANKLPMLLGFLFFWSINAFAYDFESDGIYYNITSEQTLSVTSGDVPYTGDVVIPQSVSYNGEEYTVTSIGNWAFGSCYSLTSVELPETLLSIDEWAFYFCSSLESLNLPDSLVSLGDWAFCLCYNLKTINLSTSLLSIGNSTFLNCSSLLSLILPDSLELIGTNAFEGCSSLASINVDEANPYYASLNGVLFNKDLTTLLCYPPGTGVSEYDVPEGVVSIGESAFLRCLSLNEINLPETLSIIEDNAFTGCVLLNALNVNENNKYFSSIDGILYNKDLTTLIRYPAAKTTTEFTVPESVTSIGNYAFQANVFLVSINLHESITFIGDGAFDYCNLLKSIVIPENITSIGNETFASCGSLESIYIPASVTSIGKEAFFGCDSLVTIDLPESLTFLGDQAFRSCHFLQSIDLPDAITYIGEETFSYCRALVSVSLPESLISIGKNAFYDCTSLSSISLPNSLTSIGKWAFEKCVALETVVIPESVESIDEEAFNDCSALNTVTFLALNPIELGAAVFTNISPDAVLYVYNAFLEYYENSECAQYFSEIIPLDGVIPDVPAEYVEISGYTTDTIYVDDIVSLIATVYPEDCTYPEVEWSSSNPEVASVSETGVVTALSPGNAEITVKVVVYPLITDTWNVTVVKDGQSRITTVLPDENGKYVVYSLNGTLLITTSDYRDLSKLDKGLYIVNGRKVVVRK